MPVEATRLLGQRPRADYSRGRKQTAHQHIQHRFPKLQLPQHSMNRTREPLLSQWFSLKERNAGLQFSSVPQSCLTLRPHELQHARPPCPSPTPGVYLNPCPSNQWCHPTISSSVVPFSCPQSLPASVSFQMSQLFTSGGQIIGVSASTSVPPTNTQE